MYDLYAIFKQTHPPSAIEHCLVCNFYSAVENDLIVAGTSYVRVYTLIEDKNHDDIESEDLEGKGETSGKKKLELVGQYSLFGSIKSMKSVRLSGNVRDSLLLSFDDAKLAIVEYDPGMHDLKTTSLHYFEEDEFKGGMRLHFNDPIIRVDPGNRCAAMWIYSHWLVVLPFRQEGFLEEHELTQASGSKAQVLPSYMINMRNIDARLSNIIDIQFLHGYYEPTLLILYEPLKTWPGRLAVRQDTCALVAISLNLTEKVNPVIWSVEHLPFDCSQVLPIPKPIGGILLFATNSLLYLNQSVPAYGVSLNSIAKKSSSFPLREQENVAITLDEAYGTFISSDRVVVSLKGGEIYVLTLVTDSIKSVRSFNFEKAASSVQTSCICSCEDGYLFLGSRLGNSLLLKYTQKVHDLFPNGVNPTIPKEGLPPHMKRRKLDSEYIHGLDDLDELEVYGADTKGTELASYSFEVCDSLLNIGPCSCVDMGEPTFLSEEFAETSFPDMEIVACSGYGKNGAISVLQKSIRPQVVTTFELPGCVDMWTVTSREPKEKDVEVETGSSTTPTEDDFLNHSFLILSRKDSSMVLRTEQEIMELDHSGFSTQYPTVCAANFGDGRYILQVTPMGVRLLDGITQIQHIPMDAGFSSIVWCSVADPYAVMMTADGTLMLLTFTCENSTPNLTVARVSIDQWSVVCACCVYKDVSGMFTTEKLVEQQPFEQKPVITPQEAKKPTPTILSTDDEEEMLYGDTDSSDVFSSNTANEFQPLKRTVSAVKKDIKPTYWCVLCRENGALEIYSVPDFKLAFCVRNFAVAPKVLVDSGTTGTTGSSLNQDENLMVKEILLTGLPDKNPKPLLAALVDQDLLIYEAFSYGDSTSTEGHLNIRFKKLQHNVLVREKKSKTKTRSLSEERPDGISEPIVGRLRPFHDISTYSGIFVCGANPFWLFKTSRNALRAHPMSIDGPVLSFAAFRNVNCPKGFLYFNKQGELRVSVLPTHLSYDAPWPVRKIPLRCTPHFIAYNRESKTHAVVSSQMDPVKVITRLGVEDREFVATEEDSRYVYPYLDKFTVQLMSPFSWEIIPNTRFELEDYERVTTMKNIILKSEETVSGMKGFIVLGTTYVYGEDLPCKGRILIFDIIEVVPEPGQPLTKNKFKPLYRKEQKGPVTVICEVSGFLLTAIGQKIYIWDFKNCNDLIGVAFIDTQLYIHTAISVKNLILIADISKSVTLLRFQEETKTLAFVSRDPSPLEVYGTEFFVDGSQLGFLVSDNDMNLVVYRYKPEDPASIGGQKLLHTADINITSCVTSFFRCRVRSEKTGADRPKDLRQASWFGTLEGGVGLVLPVPEKTFRRLHMVQNMLIHCIPHHAGLNPKAFRLLRWKHRPMDNPQHHILDFELLSKFVHLGSVERLEVTRKVGVSPAQILDDLMEIEMATSHF